MTDFRDDSAASRFEERFETDQGSGQVFADYDAQRDTRTILHVEAEDALRGSGAASQFMQSLTDHARAEKLKLVPRCGYAVAWYKRHPEAADVLAA